MLCAMTNTPGSAGYVAMERISGTLQGRSGSFVGQHSGSMSADGEQLTITVLANFGSEQLAGISGVLPTELRRTNCAISCP